MIFDCWYLKIEMSLCKEILLKLWLIILIWSWPVEQWVNVDVIGVIDDNVQTSWWLLPELCMGNMRFIPLTVYVLTIQNLFIYVLPFNEK